MMKNHPFSLTRRQCVLAGAAVSLVGTGPALAAALKKVSPLVVMVSLVGCPFCVIARDNYLAPMQGQAGLSIVQLDMRNRQLVQDFSGASQTQDELIRRWGIKVAPTLLFFGRGGVEVAERMVGGYIPDFYGAYLDDRLRTARAAVAG
ncbi:MAG TPA: hypothetical protein VLQ47_01025 [Rhodoferax sp.]|nr:hypothetical protein [Rhodoferax sp.]